MSPLVCVAALLAQEPVAEALTLERAVELAVSRNERAHIAQAQADAAQGRLTQARAFFFPSLTVTGQYTRRAFEVVREINGQTVPLQQSNALNGNATLRWILFDGRSIPLYRAASADQRAAGLEAAEAKRRLGFEAAEAFLQTLSLQLVDAAARRRVELTKRNVDDARARQAAGLSSTNDVTRSELEAATALREETRARGQLQSARLNLAWLLDVAPEALGALRAPEALSASAKAQPARLEPAQAAAAPSSRLDTRALGERAVQAEALAQEPLLRLVPTIGLTVQGRLTNETGFLGRPYDGFIGVDFSWALFDGGARYGARGERAAAARAATLSARLQERAVAVEVENALVALEASRASEVQAQVAVEAATRNAQETGELYRQGLTTALQQADAAQSQFEAEVALVRERYAVLLALLDLRTALGVDALGREVQP